MNLAPLTVSKFFDNDGNPLVGGKLFTYSAGSTTKLATYTDVGGLTPNTNPIILNFRGEARVWIDPTLYYKFVLAPSTDTDPPTNPIWTVDNITAAASVDNTAVDTGSGNSIVLSIPVLPSTPTAFTRVVWKSAITNSAGVTITLNGGPAKNLLSQRLAALVAGDISINGIYEAVYDGTQWQLQALSQSIAPTWTARHTFTASSGSGISGTLSLNANDARLHFYQANGSADNKLWRFLAESERFTFDIANDAVNAANTVLAVDRTGTVVDIIAFSATTMRFNTTSATTVGAAGGASALPATPLGYITVNVNGTACKIPYYNT